MAKWSRLSCIRLKSEIKLIWRPSTNNNAKWTHKTFPFVCSSFSLMHESPSADPISVANPIDRLCSSFAAKFCFQRFPKHKFLIFVACSDFVYYLYIMSVIHHLIISVFAFSLKCSITDALMCRARIQFNWRCTALFFNSRFWLHGFGVRSINNFHFVICDNKWIRGIKQNTKSRESAKGKIEKSDSGKRKKLYWINMKLE